MAVIYCPQCDSEIPESVAVCPSCGFNLDTYNESNTENEFNALLSAANKKLSEESTPAADEPVFNEGGAISQSQIDALLGGNIVDLSGETPAPQQSAVIKTQAKSPAKQKPAPIPEAAKSEQAQAPVVKSENGDEKTAEPPAEEKKVQKKPKKMKVKKERKPISTGAITFLAAIVAAALGFCVSLLLFGNVITSSDEAFAIKAANAVNSTLSVNERLCVYKAYVKSGAAMDECILYTVTDHKDVVKAAKYRITISHDNKNVTNVYYTLDENSPEYIAMKESSDPEVRVQASVLKSYSDSIENAHREISIGAPGWNEVDISAINSRINSSQSRETN